MAKNSNQAALRRLRIAKGQMAGLIKMVEERQYCIDIITQASAVKEAITGIEHLILENHLSSHVLEQIRGGKEKKAIDEIMKVYKLARKNR